MRCPLRALISNAIEEPTAEALFCNKKRVTAKPDSEIARILIGSWLLASNISDRLAIGYV